MSDEEVTIKATSENGTLTLKELSYNNQPDLILKFTEGGLETDPSMDEAKAALAKSKIAAIKKVDNKMKTVFENLTGFFKGKKSDVPASTNPSTNPGVPPPSTNSPVVVGIILNSEEIKKQADELKTQIDSAANDTDKEHFRQQVVDLSESLDKIDQSDTNKGDAGVAVRRAYDALPVVGVLGIGGTRRRRNKKRMSRRKRASRRR